jgi:hypothetical protein
VLIGEYGNTHQLNFIASVFSSSVSILAREANIRSVSSNASHVHVFIGELLLGSGAFSTSPYVLQLGDLVLQVSTRGYIL